MSGTTVSGYSTIGLTLTNPAQNPVTITDTGEIYSSMSNAIDGSRYSAWVIDNLGTLGSTRHGGSIGPTYVAGAGISLGGGGYVTNGSPTDHAGYIFGTSEGVAIGHGSVSNFGTISGRDGDGIGIDGDGSVTNGSPTDHAGYIFGTSEGVAIQHGSVSNFGTISGRDGYGIVIDGVGTITNGSATDQLAFVYGSLGGAAIFFADSVLANYGTIDGGKFFGVNLDDSVHATIVNGSATDRTAFITAGYSGAVIDSGTLINFATIMSGTLLGVSAYGVSTDAEATIVNSGLIEGAQGVLMGFFSTLVNSGTIIGGNSVNIAVDFGGVPSLSSRLIIDPGAVFIGKIEGRAQVTMELASASSAGTVTGIGTQFTDVATIAIDTGASWLVSGNSIGLAAGQTINGFSAGDTIELVGFTAVSDNYVTGKGLELSNGTIAETLNLEGSFSTGDFTVTTNADGTEIIICYLRGTNIMTDHGEVAIERLAIGDAVVTRSAGVQKIKWIGRQSFARRFLAAALLPVRIAAGAFSEGVPGRDLFVSPGHSMLLDGTLVLAKLLVNGVTITQNVAPEDIYYYQLEFEQHDCVLAEGAWSESYANCAGMRDKFHNAREFDALYPDDVAPAEPVLCAARPQSGPVLAAALLAVVARATALITPGELQGWIDTPEDDGTIRGWARDAAHPRLPVLLEILLDEVAIGTVLASEYRGDLQEAGLGDGRCSFRFTPAQPIGPAHADRLEIRRLGGRCIAGPEPPICGKVHRRAERPPSRLNQLACAHCQGPPVLAGCRA